MTNDAFSPLGHSSEQSGTRIARTFDVQLLRREEFPWTRSTDTIYLNNAGTGPLPRRTIETLDTWNRARARPWSVTDHEVVFPALAHTRALCARLIGAMATEIALVPNTSYGLSLAARMLPLSDGDVVLTFDGEFPSVIHAWRSVERSRGVELRLVPMRDGLPDEERLLAALDAPRVRAVTVSWVSFANGYKIDIERLGAACRERAIFFVLDAVQGLGPSTLDVRACGADILACGGHKWLLAPWGTAFVYVRDDLISRLDPPMVGWLIGPSSEDYSRLLDYDLTYFADARKFEMFTLPSQDFAGMGRSLELILETGPRVIEQHVRSLADRMIASTSEDPTLRLVTPAAPSKRSGIVAIALPDPYETSQRLHRAGIRHSLRQGAIRFAPYLYNTTEEVDLAVRILSGER